jgi:hypothetical protein
MKGANPFPVFMRMKKELRKWAKYSGLKFRKVFNCKIFICHVFHKNIWNKTSIEFTILSDY